MTDEDLRRTRSALTLLGVLLMGMLGVFVYRVDPWAAACYATWVVLHWTNQKLRALDVEIAQRAEFAQNAGRGKALRH